MPRADKSAGVKRAAKKATAKRAVADKPKATEPKATSSATRKRTSKVAAPKKATQPAKGSPIKKATLADQSPKVQRLIESGKEYGYTATVENPSSNVAVVTLRKDDEEIVATFADGKLDRSNRPYILVAGRQVLLKGASGVIRQMAGEGSVRKDLPKRERKRKADREEGEGPVRRVRLPFNVEEDHDEAILDAVAGRKIQWRIGLSGAIDEARIKPRRYCPKCGRPPEHEGDKLCHRSGCGGLVIKDQKTLTITLSPTDERILNFVDAKQGAYRSIHLSRLITVR